MKKTTLLILLAIGLLFMPSQACALLSKTNFCYGTLGSSIASAAGVGSTYTFAPGTNAGACPTSSFKVVIFSAACSSASSCATREIMTVTRSSTTFTIVSRQDEGTTKPASWPVGAKVYHDLTATTFDEAYSATAVQGPGSSTDNYIPQWNGTGGVLLRTGVQLDTDAALTANSDTRIGSQKAIKTYVDQRVVDMQYGVTIGAASGSLGLTNVKYGISPLNSLTTGDYNLAVGFRPLYLNTTGVYNTALGAWTLDENTSGRDNVAVGYQALTHNTTGSENIGVGLGATGWTTTGSSNVGVGYSALSVNTTGSFNVAVGTSSLGYPMALAVNGNTAIGHEALYSSVGNYNVGLGYKAGYYETGSNKLFIDNQARASEADGRAKALIYGVFDASVANQKVTVNGQLTAQGHLQTTGTVPSVGTCGTSPTITGTDNAFTVTTGSTATTACTVAFATTWTAAPRCVVSNVAAAPIAAGTSSTSTTTVVLAYASSTSAVFTVHCQ